VLLALVAVTVVWSAFGRLDIIAVAQGRIVPQSYLQIVQPRIRHRQGAAGARRRPGRGGTSARADGHAVLRSRPPGAQERAGAAQPAAQAHRRRARRHGARSEREDPPALFAQVDAQYRARRQAFLDSLETEKATLAKADQDLRAAREIESKLRQQLPIYREQEAAFEKLTREGYAGRMLFLEKQRDRIEKEAGPQGAGVRDPELSATIEQSRKRVAQLQSNYHQALQNERVETEAQYAKLEQDWNKHAARHDLLELRAPQDGIVKDLATHTVGSVLQPGTVLMTLVPSNDPMQAGGLGDARRRGLRRDRPAGEASSSRPIRSRSTG